MTVTLGFARYREMGGRDSLERASLWQGNAGTLYGLNLVYSSAGLATATVTSQVKTASTVGFAIGGTLFSKAATDNFWTLSGATVAASSFQKYLLCVDDAGVATAVECTQSTVNAAGVTFGNINAMGKAFPQNPWAPLISVLSASRCIFGVLTVATATATTFIPGTTLLGAAGITATYINGIDPLLSPLMANETGLIVGQKV